MTAGLARSGVTRHVVGMDLPPERPLFEAVGRPTAGRPDRSTRAFYLLIVLVLVGAAAMLFAQVRGRVPLTIVEIDLQAAPSTE